MHGLDSQNLMVSKRMYICLNVESGQCRVVGHSTWPIRDPWLGRVGPGWSVPPCLTCRIGFFSGWVRVFLALGRVGLGYLALSRVFSG